MEKTDFIHAINQAHIWYLKPTVFENKALLLKIYIEGSDY